MTKAEAIENLYGTFRKYTPSNMHHCDCGCIHPDDVRKLASKKLRDLEESDFASYHGSALYTWGELSHYKHFLPRVLEVHNALKGRGLIGLYEITVKLDYAEWEDWDEEEVKVIKDFIFVDWNEYVNERKSEIGKDDLGYYSFFIELEDLVKSWKIDGSGKGLQNFVSFLYYHGSEIIHQGLSIEGRVYDTVFRDFIHQKKLIETLEEEFFRVESSDSKYAERISIVTQMIEQVRKIVD